MKSIFYFEENESGVCLRSIQSMSQIRNFLCTYGYTQRKWLSGTFPHPLVWKNEEFYNFFSRFEIKDPEEFISYLIKGNFMLTSTEATYFKLKFCH